jgi:phenylacetate-CoA ligase
MRRIDRISGRTDDMLIVRGVNVYPTQIEALILAERGLAPHYYLEVSREGHLDALTIYVEMQESVAAADYAAASRAFAHSVKSHVGVSAKIVAREPGTIERSLGKARRVIDKRRI